VKLRMVDPKTIKVPEVRVTARMDEETSQQFDESVKAIGIDEPLKCFEVEGELYLSDGLHRLAAALREKMDRVPVTVRPGTMVDVLANNLMAGHLRGKHPVSEMRRSIEALYKEFNIGIEDIQQKTGLTRDYIERLLLISELTPMLLEAVDEGRIGVGLAYALTRIKDPVRQEVTFNMILSNGWRGKRALEFVDEVLRSMALPVEEQPPPPPREVPGVKCQFCGEVHPPTELVSVVCCHPCQLTMLTAIAQARAEAGKEVP